jgi:hypothetical protein
VPCGLLVELGGFEPIILQIESIIYKNQNIFKQRADV